MAKKLDYVIVVDVEATCWDGPTPPGEVNEIIEIGICPLEISTGKRHDRRSILLRPKRSRVSEFCTKLTTLTQEQVDSGTSLMLACEVLRREYHSRDRVWASFGDYDRKMFEQQCQAEGVPYPFGPRHLNVKTLFGLMRGLPHEVGMAEAVAMIGQPLDGTHHRGDDDAWNIAGVLAHLLQRTRST